MSKFTYQGETIEILETKTIKTKRGESMDLSILQKSTDNKFQISELSVIFDQQLNFGCFNLINRHLKHAFRKIFFYSNQISNASQRLPYAILRVFRTANYTIKFVAFTKLKNINIQTQLKEIKYTQNILSNLQKVVVRLIVNMIKNKRRRMLQQAFRLLSRKTKKQIIQTQAKLINMYNIIIKTTKKTLQIALLKIKSTKYIQYKNRKIKSIINIIKDNRVRILKYGLINMKKNMIIQRQNILKYQIQQISYKIQNQNQEEFINIKQRQQKLKLNLEQINKEKQLVFQNYRNQLKQVQDKCNSQRIQKLLLLKQISNIKTNILNVNSLINQQYNSNEIYQLCYNNMLVFLYEHLNQPINKNQLIQNMLNPLIPINVNLIKVKQQNLIIKQLINEYLIIFGPIISPLKQYQIPFQYLLKQNLTLHKILTSLLQKINLNRDDIGNIREKIYQASLAVKNLQQCNKK